MSIKLTILLSGISFVPLLSAAVPLSSLASSADAVVVGTESGATQTGKSVSFSLAVERVLSGTVQPGANLSVTWNTIGVAGMPDGSPTIRGIWFLRKGPTGGWESVYPGSGGNAEFFARLSVPVSASPLPTQLAYVPGATAVSDQVVLEAAANPSNPEIVLGLAAGNNSPAALQALRFMASSGAPAIANAGTAGLIRAGDTAGLLATESIATRLTAGTPGADRIASSVRLQFRNPDPSAVASLGRMTTEGNATPELQKASAHALSAIHSKESLPWLGKLLDSPSLEMQICGAQGLSYFVNGVGIASAGSMPGLDHLNQRQASSWRTPETDQNIGYKTGEPGPFIAYWKAWWQQHPELH